MTERLYTLVNNVADSLSKEECRTLLYLCSDLLSGECVEDLRGALLSLATHTAHTHTGQPQPNDSILKELVFQLKRFDVLKRVLGTSKQEVETWLRNGCTVSKYRVLMMEIGESLDGEELNSLIFLLRSTVPKGTLDRATSFLDVVVELEKLDEVSCEKLGCLENYLKTIRRVDLAKRVQQFQRGQHAEVTRNPVQTGIQSALGQNRQQPQGAFKTLKASIPECGMPHKQATVEAHNTTRGLCVIIDCIGYDGELLKCTFEQLGIQVFLHTMLSADDVYCALRAVSQKRELQRTAALICCLISRGSDTWLMATDPCGMGLLNASILQLFSPAQCPLLRGKPKLFFTQTYIEAEHQCQYDQYLETDGVPFRDNPVRESANSENVLWSFCKTEAGLLERPAHQSVYLQALCAVLLQGSNRRIPILDALKQVNSEVVQHNLENPEKTYTITLNHTLQGPLYL